MAKGPDEKPREREDTLVDLVPHGTIAEPPSGSRRIGTVVRDRFRLDSILGEGGMGAVFAGQDLGSGADVAVKILHDRFAQSQQHVARFLHEAKLQRSIPHPGVVHVIDFGRDELGRWFIALERLRGEDLGDALGRGALPSEEVVEIGHQLLSVLAATHGQAVIHRDVKPENIFLARDEAGALRVKLLDFGIAKAIGGKNVEPMIHTLEGMKLGTPHYMSPEQWAGHDLSARSDVWAAGAVLFTATMGEPPFDADDVGALSEKVRKTAPPSLRSLRPDLGPAFVDTIDRSLATDPLKRFSDCRAMAAALHTGGVRVEELDW